LFRTFLRDKFIHNVFEGCLPAIEYVTCDVMLCKGASGKQERFEKKLVQIRNQHVYHGKALKSGLSISAHPRYVDALGRLII
jgi:hypothetical protein